MPKAKTNPTAQADGLMKCRKCRKLIVDGSKFCNFCGTPQKEEKMYRRPDGLYEKIIVLDGKRVAFRAKTEKEVTHKIAEYEGRKERGLLFEEVAEQWKESHLQTIAHNTAVGYAKAYERAVQQFGTRPIREITPNDVSVYVSILANQSFALKTVRNHLLVLNLICKYAIIQGELAVNPAQYNRPPKNLARHVRELPSDEQLALVKQHGNTTFGLLPFVILYTGFRRGEIIALTYSDIDYKAGVIRINKSAYHEGNKANVKTPKSRAGFREVPLLDVLMERLPLGKPNDFIFPGKNGMMSLSEFRSVWNAFCKEIGEFAYTYYTDKQNKTHAKIVPNITPHQLRHGYATILFEAGINEKDAQELLGHSSIQMTRDVYTHIRKTRKQETAQILNTYTQNTQ